MKFHVLATIFILAATDARSDIMPVSYTFTNNGNQSMSCDIKLAHWYSDHLTDIPPKQTVGFTLWADTTDGTIYHLNDAGDRIPVERVWCGQQNHSWDSRFEIPLPRHAGQTVADASFACHFDGSTTLCDAQ